MQADNGLSVSVLGEFRARLGEQALDLGGPRQRAVLALLLVARGEVVPVGRLVHALWGEQAPSSPQGALQAYVSRLRRRLEPGRSARSRQAVIVSAGAGYAVRLGDDAVDAWQFERLIREAGALTDPNEAARVLDQALGLWHGPAFADYAGQPWIEAEAARLTELREVAREQVVAVRLALGESGVLVPEIETLVAEDPLREERWRLLVLALYRAHRQGDALGALRRARQVLAEELGVDPGPALRRLEADVLAQSPDLDAPAPPSVPRSGSAPDPSVPPVHADNGLVDRERELRVLTGGLADALAGHGRLVLIEGPAGIGKSRLLAEARHTGRAGFRVLSARGSRMEKEYAFGVVRQLFEPVVASTAALSGAAVPARIVFDLAAHEPQQRAEDAFAVLHGLYWLTVNLCAERPLVLTVDDLQWCDTGSLRFLAYLVRRLEALPVLMVAALRTGEPHTDDALLTELAHDEATVRVRPAPLTAAGSADLVRRLLGESADARFVAACHRTTSGNPLLLRQLLHALQTEGVRPDDTHADTVAEIGSRAVSSNVLMRLARLPEAATATAQAVAVLGAAAALPAVAALAGLPEAEVLDAIAALVRAEVLRDEYPLGFVHPLVGDAIYRDLPPGDRQVRHERAARVLDAAGASAEQIAAHLLQVPCRGAPWVVEVLRRSAATAAARGAADAAATYLARALQEPPHSTDKPAVLLELGRVETLGDGPAAKEHLRQAYETLTDAESRAAAAQLLARTLVFAGEVGEASAFARSAASTLPADLHDERQVLLGVHRIGGYIHGLDPALWRCGPEPVVSGDGPGARMLAASLAWEAVIDGEDRARAVDLARFALADGVLLDHDNGLLWVVAGMVLEMADEDTFPFWDEALAHAYRGGSLFAALAAHLWRGYTEWRRGDLRAAYHSVTLSGEQSAVWGSMVASPYADAFAIGILLDTGDLAQARALVEGLRDRPRFGDGARLFAEAHARVLLAEGRPAQALAALESVQHVHEDVLNPVWRPWRSNRAQVLAALGRRDEAVTLVEQELRLARAWGAPSVLGRTLRILGELRGGAAELREAVPLLTRDGLERARTLAALARLVPEPEATALMTRAYELAQRCGAHGLIREVGESLARAGIEPPAPPAGITLTSVERRIAAMATDGADERQIAQALFVTPGAVQQALRTVRDRLGVR
ncbi:BTAD domain-containing putative transcriptional regulator [Micromonospora mangrovi]|uniref:BTAD domain-containing putative transcriptional regulator n=2 Tax=Micromonospora TaxID=1873 RepID=A0AAU7MDJ5_9ACTN